MVSPLGENPLEFLDETYLAKITGMGLPYVVREPGRKPYALKCALILTSDIVKRWYRHFNKVGHACQIWSKFHHFEIQDGRHSKIDIWKKWSVYGQYAYQNETHGKQNMSLAYTLI